MRSSLSQAAKRRMREHEGEGLLRSDWMEAVFIHYRLEPAALQPFVPFSLDVRDGAAYVSLVAFTMRRMRPSAGGRLAALLTRAIATHPFLNLRTYVRHGGEPGIYFLAEWLPNRLSVFLGPRTFGLPYRLGLLRYRHTRPNDICGCVNARRDGRLSYTSAGCGMCGAPRAAEADTLDEFLLERYTAFTRMRRRSRRFRVWHKPWPAIPVEVSVDEASLLANTGAWWERVEQIGAHWSPGVRDVWMGRPVRLRTKRGEEVRV